jgi:hypothetical protein
MDARRERIQWLSRIEHRRVMIPRFIAGLCEALGESVDEAALVSAVDSDAIMMAYRSGYQGTVAGAVLSYRRYFRPNERKLVFRAADCLGHQLPAEEVFFLSKMGTDTGVVKLNLSVLLRNAEAVMHFDGDSISALSADHGQGLLIDHNPDEHNEAFEVAIWGDRWPLLFLARDS